MMRCTIYSDRDRVVVLLFWFVVLPFVLFCFVLFCFHVLYFHPEPGTHAVTSKLPPLTREL